jgi:hypothetical protein
VKNTKPLVDAAENAIWIKKAGNGEDWRALKQEIVYEKGFSGGRPTISTRKRR